MKGNIAGLMKQAQQMQENMKRAQMPNQHYGAGGSIRQQKRRS